VSVCAEIMNRENRERIAQQGNGVECETAVRVFVEQ
jgi:hypothetical protein